MVFHNYSYQCEDKILIVRNVAVKCGGLLVWQAGERFWAGNQFLSFSEQYNQKLKNMKLSTC